MRNRESCSAAGCSVQCIFTQFHRQSPLVKEPQLQNTSACRTAMAAAGCPGTCNVTQFHSQTILKFKSVAVGKKNKHALAEQRWLLLVVLDAQYRLSEVLERCVVGQLLLYCLVGEEVTCCILWRSSRAHQKFWNAVLLASCCCTV